MPQDSQLRAIFDAMGDGLFVADSSGLYVEVNPAGCAMLGYPREELVGRRIHEVVDPSEFERVDRALVEMGNRALDRSEWLFRRKDGSVFTGELVGGQLADGRYQSIVRDVSDRVEREALVQLLRREAAHRTKNIIAVIQAIARRTASGRSEEFLAAFEERMSALVASQALFDNDGWSTVGVDALVHSQLQPFMAGRADRVRIAGDEVMLRPAAAQSLGMALHELATNAAKYGALSNAVGTVEITWQIATEIPRTFTLAWSERDGPPVSAPERTGFGTTMIERVTGQALGARSQLSYHREGLAWTLACELAALSDDRAP